MNVIPTATSSFVLSRLQLGGDSQLFAVRWEDRPAPVQPLYLVEKLLPQGTLNILVSPSGIGKTTLMLELANCVTNGTPFKGRAVDSSGPVLLVDNEMGRAGVHRYCSELGMTGYFQALHNVPYRELVALIEAAHQEGCKLVIIDSYTSLVAESTDGGDPMNSATSTDRLLSPLLNLAHDSGITIIVLHHTNKDDVTFVGSQRIRSLPDELYELSLDEENWSMTLKPTKNRNEIVKLIWDVPDHSRRGEIIADPAESGHENARVEYVLGQLHDGPVATDQLRAGFIEKFQCSPKMFQRHKKILVDSGMVSADGEQMQLVAHANFALPEPERTGESLSPSLPPIYVHAPYQQALI